MPATPVEWRAAHPLRLGAGRPREARLGGACSPNPTLTLALTLITNLNLNLTLTLPLTLPLTLTWPVHAQLCVGRGAHGAAAGGRRARSAAPAEPSRREVA